MKQNRKESKTTTNKEVKESFINTNNIYSSDSYLSMKIKQTDTTVSSNLSFDATAAHVDPPPF